MVGLSRALRSPIGRAPSGAIDQLEDVAKRSPLRDQAAWLAVFAIGFAIAIALVAQGDARAYVGLLIVAGLAAARIGTLIEEHQHLRAEALAVAGIMEGIGPAGSVREAIQTSFSELLTLLDARAILVVAHDRSCGRIHSWLVQRADVPIPKYAELPASEEATYLFPAPAESWLAIARRHSSVNRFQIRGLRRHEVRAWPAALALPEKFLASHPFQSMLVVST